MTPETHDTAWFAPKRYGYGSGLPIAWQGWALMIGYVLVVIAAAQFIAWDEEVGWIAFIAAMLALGAPPERISVHVGSFFCNKTNNKTTT